MVRLSKRMKQIEDLRKTNRTYSLEEAISNVTQFPKVKFDEMVELHFHLAIDTKDSEHSVRGTVVLPHGTGKTIRIAAFCKGENAQKAQQLGADHVGAEDLIEKVSKGFLEFDCVIATPDLMRELSKLGRILGPRGLMPSPKIGTVTPDIERAIKEVKAGKVEFKVDKQGGIHIGIGKRSFTADQLLQNGRAIVEAIEHAKPAGIKGNFIKSLFVSSTMGPGLKVAL